MNWLAHLRLAPPDPLLLVGNLCGDFVRGIDLASLHPEVRRGIDQHRAIDRFVDAHPVAGRSRQRLRPHRFAGALTDVFYDHFLARDWQRFGAGRTLGEFVADVHATLTDHVELLPPRLRRVLPWMREEDWLLAYADLAGVDRILQRMSGRSPRRRLLLGGAALLRQHYAALEDDFLEFWPLLAAFADANGGP